MSAPFALPVEAQGRFVYSSRDCIASCNCPKYAESFVRACNSHDALVAALSDLLTVMDEDIGMDEFEDDASVGTQQIDGKATDSPLTFGHLRRARRALASTKETP